MVESADLSDEHRAVLLATGFLRQVMKGWYISANPADDQGDSTAWYASFWAFLSGYLGKRFGKRYCLNPEASLLLHTGHTAVPRQVVAVAGRTGAKTLSLPFDTSLLLYQDAKRVPRSRVARRGLQVWPVAEAMCLVGPSFFIEHPREAEIALAMVRDPSELLATLLEGDGMRSAAARLAGALQFVGRSSDAQRIVTDFSAVHSSVRPENPFAIEAPSLAPSRERSPYVLRLRSMWAGWREAVIARFPAPPGIPVNAGSYLAQVQERYVADAYNSLSIEGYQVTDALIEAVARGDWNPEGDDDQRRARDALAARGYYQAFRAVKASISRIIAGEPAADVVRREHRDWYAELFAPSVSAGILKRHQLVGYRSGPVFIRNSQHVPLPREALLDALEALFDLIAEEPHPAVRAVLGKHLFVFIHPYFDGNGRIGRFLMNALFASGGYPWTVIRVSRRAEYLQALDQASVSGEITLLARFIAREMAQTP